jgi:carboxyl-terminal processing protease
MNPKSRNILLALVGVVLFAGVCTCAAATGIFAYSTFGDTVEQFIDDPSALFEPTPPIVGAEPIEQEPETPVGADIDLAELFAPFWEARQIIHDEFYEQPVDDDVLAQGALDGLVTYLADFGVDLDDYTVPETSPGPESLATEAETPSEVADSFLDFWAAWERAEYADLQGQFAYEQLMRASLGGMVESLGDQHTFYLNPDQLRQSDLSLQGEYEGIGAWVDTTTEYLTIIAPMEGSPAEAAGLLPGDRVLAIDGEDMTGLSGDEVISHILGPEGTEVTLTIGREGEPEPFDVVITRARIFVASVESEILEDDIAYVQLFTFGASTNNELRTELEDVLAENPRALIFDLRNNGGGYLDTAIQVASEFIADGVILNEEFGDGTQQTYRAQGDGLATDIELIVLVNAGSASASEIVAGAIQDYGRGLLVGETTYGKGSVQVSPSLSNSQGALRITVAHWLTPEGRQIHELGLEPDIAIPLTEEDSAAELDPQLDAALEYLTQ